MNPNEISSVYELKDVHENNTETKTKNKKKKSKQTYFPAIDGLRAIAVFGVVAYHFNFPWATGGLLGVTVFFVISGFLITSILISEISKTGKIDLPRFWFRRVRRLFPAIALVVFTTAILAWLLNPSMLYKLKVDFVPALLWFTNWWNIFKQESYFDTISTPSPVLHFWSLSIEEQFYIIWPIFLIILFMIGLKRRSIRRVCAGLAIISAILMALLYNPEADPSRIYYGTDTRAFSLLIGAYLAFLWPVFSKNPRFSISRFPDIAFKVVKVAGPVALVVLLILGSLVSGTSQFWYYGGLFLASILSAIVIASATLKKTALARVLSTPAFVWLGTRSYGIYLWHYPLLLLMNPNSAASPGFFQIIGEVAVILIVSELSFRFVEDPIRKGKLGKAIIKFQQGRMSSRKVKRARIAVLASFALVLFAGIGLATANNPNEGKGLLTDADIAAGTSEGTIEGGGEASSQVAEENKIYDPVFIGDSVSIGLTDVFHEAFPGGVLDAAGNRQITMGVKVYEYYRDKGAVSKNVVIALGANGAITTEALQSFVDLIGSDKKIWLVTVSSSESDDDSDNASMYTVAANNPENVSLINWQAYSSNNKSAWLQADGLHLTNEGRTAYMQMIVSAIGNEESIVEATKKANEEAGGAWKAPSDGSMTTEMKEALYNGITPAAAESRKVTGEALPV